MKLKAQNQILALTFTLTALSGCAFTQSENSKRAPAQQIAPEVTILITSFEPVDEKKVNNSVKISALLEAKNGTSKVHYVSCPELPMVYDDAAKRAQACVKALGSRPDYVISLGEGYCEVHLETIAYNEDNTWNEDNTGTVRVHRVINQMAPKKLGFTLPQNEIFCGMKKQANRVFASTHEGQHVHNNLAFQLANYFRGETIPYGFIHVPAHSCTKAGKPDQTAEALHQAFIYLVDNDPYRKTRTHEAFPVNSSEFKTYAQHHSAYGEEPCVQEFYHSLDHDLKTVD